MNKSDDGYREFYRKIVAQHPGDTWFPDSIMQVNPILDSSYENTVHACQTVIEFLHDMTTLNDFDEMLSAGGRSGLCTVLGVVSDTHCHTWDEVHPRPSQHGFTCCHDHDLLNLRAAFDERIDFVLVRDDRSRLKGKVVRAVRAEVLGDEIDDLTDSGLWPSDHGGLISRIRLLDRDDDDRGKSGKSGRSDRDRGEGDNDDDDWDDDDDDDD